MWSWSYGSWIYNYLCNQVGVFLRILRFPPQIKLTTTIYMRLKYCNHSALIALYQKTVKICIKRSPLRCEFEKKAVNSIKIVAKRNKATLISLWSRGRAISADIGQEFCPLHLVCWALNALLYLKLSHWKLTSMTCIFPSKM